MFRPAGFSDSEGSDHGFSTNRRQFSDEESETFSLRRARESYGGPSIPWDTINNNEPPVSISSSDMVISDPALIPVLDKTKKYLRSTLLSHKGGVEMHQLNNDYRELVGEGIPYTKLKFNGLESFLRSLPTVCSLWRSCGEMMVKGVAGEASQHIQNMVAMQKTTMKGKSRKKGNGKKKSSRSNFEKEMDDWHRQFAAPPSRSWGSSAAPPARSWASSAQPPPLRERPPVQQAAVKPVKARVEPVVQQLAGLAIGGVVTKDMVMCGYRVRELLQGRVHGLYVAQLEKMYQKKFSESLPGDWSDKLAAAGSLSVVKEVGGLTLVRGGEGGTVNSDIKVSDGIADKNRIVGQTTDTALKDMGMIKDRVTQLLQGRVYGLLVSQVEKMYSKQWGDALSRDWVTGIENLGGVVVDREGEQVLVKIGVNGTKIPAVRDNVASPVANQTLTNGVGKLGIVSGTRREMVDKVRQMGRVKQLLQGRLHGLFVAQVEKMHQKNFGEGLVSTWLEEMEQAGSVEVERMQSGQVVVRWREGTKH